MCNQFPAALLYHTVEQPRATSPLVTCPVIVTVIVSDDDLADLLESRTDTATTACKRRASKASTSGLVCID